MHSSDSIVNALSFDIEDWFHLVGIESLEDRSTWPIRESIVVRYTELILKLLDKNNIKATFFMLGWVAERHSELAKMISDEGHEVGTHSYWHRRVDLLTPDEFYRDLKTSIEILENQTGKQVLGFRAPSFSIRPGVEWAFDILLDLGLKYDSSLFPARRGHGGYPCPEKPHVIDNTPSGRQILELPISVIHHGMIRLPFSGGGYLRLLPDFAIKHGFKHNHRRNNPVVVYLHPRDFAVDCPAAPMPLIRRIKSHIGQKSTIRKLQMMLKYYRFDTCATVLRLDSSSSR